MLKISTQRIPVKRNRIIAFFIHYGLSLFFLPYLFVRLFVKNSRSPLPFGKIRKILIIRTDGLGDVSMSTHVFRCLREIFPRAHITLLAASWSRALIEVMPTFDSVIYFDAPWMIKAKRLKKNGLLKTIRKLRKDKFDLAIDLRGDFRNNILMFLCKAKWRIGYDITGCHFLLTSVVPVQENHHPVDMGFSLIKYLAPQDAKKYRISLWVTQEDRERAAELLSQNGIKDFDNDRLIVVIHPAARWYGRQWTTEGYAEIADRLIREYQANVIFTGSYNETRLTDDITDLMIYKPIIAIGKTSLRQFLALLEKSDLFIGVDSGPMHMAAAMGTKVIALFGAARPQAVGPYGDGHIVVTRQDDFPCSPCAQTICKRPDNSCMQAIGVEEVWAAVESQMTEILKERNRIGYENTSCRSSV